MSHHRYHPQGRHQHEPGQGFNPKAGSSLYWLHPATVVTNIWNKSKGSENPTQDICGAGWTQIQCAAEVQRAQLGLKGQRQKTNQESGGECGRITICLWLGARGKGMQKQGMEGLCLRKGQRRTAGVCKEGSGPKQHNLRWRQALGPPAWRQGLGMKRVSAGKAGWWQVLKRSSQQSRWKGNKECTPTCAPPYPQTLGCHSEIQTILVPANGWKPLSCLFSFQQNIQEKGACPLLPITPRGGGGRTEQSWDKGDSRSWWHQWTEQPDGHFALLNLLSTRISFLQGLHGNQWGINLK